MWQLTQHIHKNTHTKSSKNAMRCANKIKSNVYQLNSFGVKCIWRIKLIVTNSVCFSHFRRMLILIMKHTKNRSLYLAFQMKRIHKINVYGYTDIRIAVNIWCSFYTCIKFMCDINWWQILFSLLPVDALLLCFVCQHEMRSNRVYPPTVFSIAFIYVISFVAIASFSLVWFVNIASLNSSLTFDFNAHNLSQCQKPNERAHITNTVAQHRNQQHSLALPLPGSMVSFYFYLAFDELAMFIQWFQSNFCIGKQCVSVQMRKQK